MRKAMVVVLSLILILLFVTACGIPREEYDKLSSDFAAVQAQIQALQGELSTKETELSAKKSELEATKEKLGQGKARIEILNAIFIPAMTGELDRMTEGESVAFFFEWRDKVIAVGDPTLTAKFESMIETFSDEALLSFFVYLLDSTADALE